MGMEWISVKKELPKSNMEDVLIVLKTRGLRKIYIGYYSPEHDWWFVSGFDRPEVKYWMPLPELPKR